MKTNHHYSSLLYKYRKFKLRLDRVMKNGSFARYTYRKRCMLLKRLDRLRRQLEQLSSKWKLAGTGAMALGAMAFAAPEVEAQGLFPSDAFIVNSHTVHNQRDPAIAMDADGDFVVVWESDGQDADGYGVYAQRYNKEGGTVGEEFKVNTYTTSRQRNPAIAMDADGAFVVVWESLSQDDDGNGVYAQRYTSDGAREGEEFKVNSHTPDDQNNPDVAMDADGDFVVVWESRDQDDDGYGVYAQRYTSDGDTVGVEFQANTWINTDPVYPAVAMDADGDFVVVWQSYLQDDGYGYGYGEFGYGVYGQRYNNEGGTVGVEFQANTWTNTDPVYPAIAMNADGDFVVVWRGYDEFDRGDVMDDPTNYGVYARRYDETGVAVESIEFQVNTNTAYKLYSPDVAMDADGDFVIAWQGYEYSNSHMYEVDNIYMQRYDNAGDPNGVNLVVEPKFYDREWVAVAMDATGDFVIVSDAKEVNSGDVRKDVYAQRFSLNVAPTALALDNNSINENEAIGTVVGSFSSTDANTTDIHTYSLVSGAGDTTGNDWFSIVEDELQTGASFDYETQSSYSIRVRTTDSKGLYTEDTFTISVNALSDNDPVLDAIGAQTVDEDVELTFTASAEDADQPAETLTYSIDADSEESGMSIDSSTGAFSWTPTEDHNGIHTTTITVSDGSVTDEEEITITVSPVSDNDPVLAAIGDQTVDEDVELTFTASATDADLPAETLTYSIDATSKASDMSIDSLTGAFSWTPTEVQVGTHTATVTVSDGTASDSEEITITVNNVLGLEDFNHQSNIYPSPSSDIVHLEMENSYRGLVKIRILDISGKLIQKEQQMKAGQILKVPITLENLKSGVHMVEISIGDQRVVKRIIKN